ncbi:MAG: tetratricopeptide repeat protein [Verrucomicrobiota bacterium]
MDAINGILQAYSASEGRDQFGPVFGHFFYLRGIVQINREQYPAALESFKICYEQFKNSEDLEKQPTSNRGRTLMPNLFRNAAQVQWANILMLQEDYAGAAELFERVLKEGPNDPKINRIFVTVNLGRCKIKAGDLEGGFKLISPALQNPRASEGLKQVVFLIIAEDWSPQVDLPPMREFLNEARAVVNLDSAEDRYSRNDRFQRLAQDAFANQDPIRALAWYSLMVDPATLIPGVEKEIAQLEAREVSVAMQAKKTQFLEDLAKKKQKMRTDSWNIINGLGSAHFTMRNFGASYVAFSKLAEEVPESHKDRALYHHNSVVSAAQTNRWRDTYRFGKIFLLDYPEHELKPGVARVLVEVVFLNGEYQEAYDIAKDVRTDMELGSSIRDVPDFVVGASAFQLDKVEEAEQELDGYLVSYPEGERREPVQFFAGLTKVRLYKWEEAATILNQFIETYPESGMIPAALYQCALSEFMLDRYEASLAKVERIIAEYPDDPSIARAWNLKGDIFSTEERPFEEVEPCYLTGRDRAYELEGEEETAAYAIWQLLMSTVDLAEWEKAEEHRDQFEARHADSLYRLDFLAASLPIFVEKSDIAGALDRLRPIIFEYGDRPESSELVEMFGTYLDFVQTHLDPREALQELQTQIEPALESPALHGWFRYAMFDTLGKLDENPKIREAMDQQYYRLGAGFDPSQQSNFVIVQHARWIAQKRRKPEQARQYYDFIIDNRPGTPNYDYALVDTAKLLAQSDKPEERAEAMSRFERAFSEIADDELRELCVLGMARLKVRDKNFAEAQPLWEQYLENREWTVARAEANYQYARSLDEQGQTNEALKIYVSIYANFPGHLDWSTRAYLRTATILKDSGEDLKSLLVLQDMLKRMGHHDHPVITRAKQVFVEWRAEYQPADGKGKGAAKG